MALSDTLGLESRGRLTGDYTAGSASPVSDRTMLLYRHVRATGQKVGKLITILWVASYRAALRHGVAAAVEHHAVPFEHRYLTVIDVGANRGQFALVASHRFPGAVLHCFEPLPAACR